MDGFVRPVEFGQMRGHFPGWLLQFREAGGHGVFKALEPIPGRWIESQLNVDPQSKLREPLADGTRRLGSSGLFHVTCCAGKIFPPMPAPIDFAPIHFGANQHVLDDVAGTDCQASGVTAIIRGRGVALGLEPKMAEFVRENCILVFFGSEGRIHKYEMIFPIGDAHRFRAVKLSGEARALEHLCKYASRGWIQGRRHVFSYAEDDDLALIEPFNFGAPIVERGGLHE